MQYIVPNNSEYFFKASYYKISNIDVKILTYSYLIIFAKVRGFLKFFLNFF